MRVTMDGGGAVLRSVPFFSTVFLRGTRGLSGPIRAVTGSKDNALPVAAVMLIPDSFVCEERKKGER